MRYGIALFTVLAVAATAGCGQGPALTIRNPSYGITSAPNYDNKQIDVDGDGDRARLSGRNDLLNLPADLRSGPPAGGYTPNVRYPGTFTPDRIADLAHSMNGVDAAHCVVSGRTAIIGLDLNRKLTPPQAGPIIQEIRQRVLVQAPEFEKVYITADRNLSSKVFAISEGIRRGQPLSQFDKPIDELIRQIPLSAPITGPK